MTHLGGETPTPETPAGAHGAVAATASAMADRRMETVLGRLLQAGVLLAALVVLVGGVLSVRAPGGRQSWQEGYATFHGEAPALREVGSVLRLAAHGDGAALIQLGVLLLIATPVARVVVAAAAFLLERDWLYVVVSLVVLGVLLSGLVRAG